MYSKIADFENPSPSVRFAHFGNGWQLLISPKLSYLYDDITCIFFTTGQDILTAGFTGAMFGGLLCASQVLNRDLVKDLTNLYNEIEEQSKKKVE